MPHLLDGVRVLDFGRYIAGPYCGALLGFLGAEVIRIEKRAGGEDRYAYPLDADESIGGLFLQTGQGKKSVTLNPASDKGREIVKKLVATADVVIANLPAAALKHLGLDYDSLKAIKPDIILSTMSTFGAEGPYAHRAGFDGIGQVMSGSSWFGGEPGAPVRNAAPYVDFGTAQAAAYATLAALWHRERTGEGQMIEAALLKTGVTFFNGMLIEQAVTQRNRVPSGTRNQTSAPSDIFATKDGHVLTHVMGGGIFKRLAKMMGTEERWLNDPRYATDGTRAENRDPLCEEVAAWCATRTTDECIATMEEFGVPAGPVLSPQEVLEDPQVDAMGLFHQAEIPEIGGTAPVCGMPAHMFGTPELPPGPAPALGAHTEEVLGEIGLSAEDIAALREEGVV